MVALGYRRALVLIGLFGLVLIGWWAWDLSHFLEGCRHYSRMAQHVVLPPEVNQNEAIVVLTGDRGRIPTALNLLRRRGSPWLIISGTGRGASLVDVLNSQGQGASQLHEYWNRIIAEPRSQSTIENVYESGKILLEKKISRAILVTSDYHMRRSLKIFHIVLPKIETIPYPVLSDFSSEESANLGLWAYWSVWNEYWKNRFFDWYGVKQLVPLVDIK